MKYTTLLCFFLFFIAIYSGDATVVEVGTGTPISSIRRGIEVARHGDTLVLHSGIYAEGNIVVGKSLTFLGNGNPVVDGNGASEIFTVTSANVRFYGITLQNSGVSYMQENAAIRFREVGGGAVERCIFENNFFGIYFEKAYDSRVYDCTFRAKGETETGSGNGIHLWSSRRIDIRRNLTQGHRDGMYLEFSRDCYIADNVSLRNLRYGLHFMFSDSCTYERNVFRFNGAGVAVMYAHHVFMTHNTFEENWGAAAYGLLLKDISGSRITKNYFSRNTTALYAEGSSNTMIDSNTFRRNGWAIKLLGNCEKDYVAFNNFEGNSFDVATNSRQNFNYFSRNYWSAYQGYDLNHDGLGDIPFRPVRLFSLIVEQQSPALVLLRTLFIDLLDIAERIIPAFTPETLVDSEPSMKPIV